jgi:hypothetical protein
MMLWAWTSVGERSSPDGVWAGVIEAVVPEEFVVPEEAERRMANHPRRQPRSRATITAAITEKRRATFTASFYRVNLIS